MKHGAWKNSESLLRSRTVGDPCILVVNFPYIPVIYTVYPPSDSSLRFMDHCPRNCHVPISDVIKGLYFDNTYAWVTRWNAEGQIVQVRAYLDSVLVAKAIFENEAPTNANYSTIRETIYAGPGPLPNLTAIVG